ncbi:hypothetical protein DMJ13_18420 [halophilic archaeon]|nr:hypothetical protein DMJ13_18420 [halophilic archaeon]
MESLIQQNARMRAFMTRMINLVRDYNSAEGVDDEVPNLAAAAANAGRQCFQTVERSEQNTELVNFCEQSAESQQVEEISRHAGSQDEDREENDAMIARMDYRMVATHYGCVDTNEGVLK